MIAATVILYKPDMVAVWENIQTYLEYVDCIFVIDNTPLSEIYTNNYVFDSVGKIVYVRNSVNMGIAKALNKAMSMAEDRGCQWLLTMDQDSAFGQDAAHFFQQFKALSKDEKVAIIAPSHAQTSMNVKSIEKVAAVITSGNVVSIDAWKVVGGYEEKLFIDEVDHEFCYRLLLAGYEVLKLNDVVLKHHLGAQKDAGYFAIIKKSSRTIHNEKRVYFMVRNYLFVKKKYGKELRLQEEFRMRDKQLLTTLKNNLLFSGHFFKNISNIYKGYKDFKRNNFTAVI